MKAVNKLRIGSAIIAATLISSVSIAQDTLKIGILATLEGPFTVLGKDGVYGVELAVKEFDGKVAGKKIELITASTDASPDSAVAGARKLVEQDKVDIVVGPLSGSEGLAIKEYAKTKPNITFFNGASAAQDTTLRSPAENFFRWNPDGAQWIAGLGNYAYKTKGYKKIVAIAEDYSFPYTLMFGFMHDYCKAGGRVTNKFWVPIGTKDFSSVISSIPDDIDALFVALGGSDAVSFLNQYEQSGGTKPLIAGSITIDQSVLSSKGKRKDYLIGTPTASPLSDNNETPEFRSFVEAYQKTFPDALPSPTLFAQEYYISTKAAILALKEVNGDLSDNHKKFREALSKLSFVTPAGKRSLDHNRQVITDIFLSEIKLGKDDNLLAALVERIPQVNQTMGENEADFLKYGEVGRDNPSCP